MSLESAIALGLAVFVLGVTPGPGIAATVARVLAFGLRPTLAFVAGIVTGDLVYMLLAVTGLAAVARHAGELFVLLKLAGAAYLVYLGVRCWMRGAALRAGERPAPEVALRAFASGLVLTLGNPKVILFYMGFLPTFLDLASLAPRDVVVAAAVVGASVFAACAVYAIAAARARRLLLGPGAGRFLDRAAGTVLIGAGGAVATS